MNQDVTNYIEKLNEKPKQVWQIEVCNRVREAVFQAIPDAEERLQYGKPHYRKNGKYACVLDTAKDWVSVTVFNAESLNAPDDFFEKDGPPERKTTKILNGQPVDYDLLTKLIQQAASTI
jgi:hypothetical protein